MAAFLLPDERDAGDYLSQLSVGPQAAPPRMHFRIPPEPSHLLRARERLRDYLRQYCTQREVIDDVVLCVEEAATNAIRHSASTQDIEISLSFADGDLLAEVKDKGHGFDLASFDREALPDLLSDHGRGLFIIARLMDSLELSQVGGLEVRMTRRAEPHCESSPLESALGTMRASAELDQRDTRLRAMLEEIDEAFIAFDWDYRHIYLNETAVRMSGKAGTEMIGHKPWELWPGYEDSPVGVALHEAMELGNPSIIEHHSLVTGNWQETRVYPTPAGVSIYAREINERKRIEQEIVATRAELAATLAAITDGFYTLDRTWRVTYLNDKAAEVFPGGKEALGANFWDLFPDDVGSAYEASKRRAMEHNEVCSFEFYDPPSDAWFEERDYPSANGITVLFADISERKRVDRALRDAELKSADLIRYAPTGIYEIDISGSRFRTVNDAMCAISGYTREELLAMNPADLLDAESQVIFAERFRKALAGEPMPDGVEYRFKTKDRRLRDVVLNTTFTTDDGAIDGALVVGYDVTERRQAEEALRQSAETASQAEERYRSLFGTQNQAVALAARVGLADALDSVNRLVHSTIDFDEIMQRALDEGVRALAGDAGTIEMREESCWAVRYQSGFAAEDVGVCLSEQDAPNATRTMLSREPLAIADMKPDPKTNVGFVRAHGLRSVLALPLLAKDLVIGCLLVYGRQIHQFDEAEIDFGRKLSATVSLAIENARLHEGQVEAQRRAEQELATTSLLLEAATTSTSWTDLEEMLQSLGDLLLRSTDHSRVLLELWHEQRQEVEIAVSRGAQATAKQRFGLDEISDGAKERHHDPQDGRHRLCHDRPAGVPEGLRRQARVSAHARCAHRLP